MNNDKILVERRGHTALLTIANPPANTWDLESLASLEWLVEKFNQDKDVYALVITGQGEKFFSAGADLNQFASGEKHVAQKMSDLFGRAFEALSNFRGVSIAAINGYAMGGGLECALACDIRIVEEHAQMALPEAKVGLLPCGGGTQNLAWLVGEGWAKRLILCGERIGAQRAEQIGLVEEVVPRGESLAYALHLADKVSEQSPSSVSRCKSLVMNARIGPQADGWAKERQLFVQLFDTHDQKEGVTAFLEKRTPNWLNA